MNSVAHKLYGRVPSKTQQQKSRDLFTLDVTIMTKVLNKYIVIESTSLFAVNIVLTVTNIARIWRFEGLQWPRTELRVKTVTFF